MYTAQHNKDKILNELYFKDQKKGFFVDVGAHDGKSISSTYFLESELGWSGICIEPLKRRFDELVVNRPNSVCINKAVYSRNGLVRFRDILGYPEMLSGIEEAYNEPHKARIQNELGDGTISWIDVECITLDSIFEQNNVTTVDYLKIDTEGSELPILQAIDFSSVDIKCIDVENNYNTDFNSFFLSKGYKLLLKNNIDEVYVK